jgi:hypothetical protein
LENFYAVSTLVAMWNLLDMTKKRTPKPKINIDTELVVEPPEPTGVESLLADFISMQKAEEMASAGFSMSSIAHALQIPSNRFTAWIRKGKDCEESEPNIPEVRLWKTLAKSWAIAKGLAEAKVAQVDPKFFLSRGPARMLGDDWSDDASSGSSVKKETLDVTVDFIDALKNLRARGHSLDEIIDNDLMEVRVDRQEKPVDLLEKRGITHVAPALPGPLARQTIELDNILQLERLVDDKKR